MRVEDRWYTDIRILGSVWSDSTPPPPAFGTGTGHSRKPVDPRPSVDRCRSPISKLKAQRIGRPPARPHHVHGEINEGAPTALSGDARWHIHTHIRTSLVKTYTQHPEPKDAYSSDVKKKLGQSETTGQLRADGPFSALCNLPGWFWACCRFA